MKMTDEQLRCFQDQLDLEIEAMTQAEGLADENQLPVYDGVADEAGYLSSRLKVLWLLQEPYDTGDGTGGGWSLPKDVFLKPKPHDPDNPTQQTVAYSMWCYLNHNKYDEAPEPSVVYRTLVSVAWVNLSKMPARSSTRLDHLMPLYYRYWKEIIQKQMSGLCPDVIIVAGQHFKRLSRDGALGGKLTYSRSWPENSDTLVDLYYGEGPAILYADHPAYWRQPTHGRWRPTLTQETYVNAVSDALIFLAENKRCV